MTEKRRLLEVPWSENLKNLKKLSFWVTVAEKCANTMTQNCGFLKVQWPEIFEKFEEIEFLGYCSSGMYFLKHYKLKNADFRRYSNLKFSKFHEHSNFWVTVALKIARKHHDAKMQTFGGTVIQTFKKFVKNRFSGLLKPKKCAKTITQKCKLLEVP